MQKPATHDLPAYADELDALHRAHKPELKRVIDDLPLRPGQKVLDMACGDGAYSRLLAHRLGPGLVIAVDALPQYLSLASHRDRLQETVYLSARIEAIPFDDDSFDLVWCAHSLASLPQPVAALAQMNRVVKPGGYVVVMENDSLHQLLLPWPEHLELVVRQAEFDAYRAGTWHPDKRYAGRRLRAWFQSAGLLPVRRRTYCVDRYAPLADAELEFLKQHFTRLRELVEPYLPAEHCAEFTRLTDPSSPDFLPGQPSFEMTWLDVVCCGQKPVEHRRDSRRAAKAAPIGIRQSNSLA